jgi:hypothetical protein
MAECSSTYPARRSPLRTRLCALQRHNHTDTLLLGHAGHTTSGIRAGPRCRAAHTGVRRPQKGACQCRHFVVCIETTANRIECAAARRGKRRGREGKRACLQSFRMTGASRRRVDRGHCRHEHRTTSIERHHVQRWRPPRESSGAPTEEARLRPSGGANAAASWRRATLRVVRSVDTHDTRHTTHDTRHTTHDTRHTTHTPYVGAPLAGWWMAGDG